MLTIAIETIETEGEYLVGPASYSKIAFRDSYLK